MAIVANGINISNCGVGIMSVGDGKVCAKDANFTNCNIDIVVIEDKVKDIRDKSENDLQNSDKSQSL